MNSQACGTGRHTLANLDFEYELAHGPGFQTPDKLLPVCRRWQQVLKILPGFQDAEALEMAVLDRRRPREFARPKDLCLWGVTLRTYEFVQKLGLSDRFPCSNLVRTVNDKRFSHHLEQELGVALPYSRLLETLEDVQLAVQTCPYDWVIKHPFGVSARERVVGKRGTISDSALGWCRRRLFQGWSLIFEPWVNGRTDFSLHWEIQKDGQLSWLGACHLQTDLGGVYRGNRVLPSEPLEPSFRATGQMVAERLASLGYWGPVSLDALSGHLGEQRIQRPLVEINARYSFGRLTLALGSWVPEGWSYFWWHPKPGRSLAFNQAPSPLKDQERSGIYRLPEFADPEGNSGTWVLIGESSNQLQALVDATLTDPSF